MTKSVHVTPSGNTIFSPSYTVVGIQKPDGGCGKGLTRKLEKGKGPTIPVQKSMSKETSGSSSKPLRIKRANKAPILKSCVIFEDEEPLPPQDPTIASLNNKITTLHEQVRFLRGQVDDSRIKIKGLEHELNICCFSFGRRLAKVAKATKVEWALDA